MNIVPTVDLKGWAFADLTEKQCVNHVLAELRLGRGGWVVTANLDHLRRLIRNRAYAALCERADLIVADGMPLIWASRIQGTPLPERVAGSSLIYSLSAGAAEHGRSVFLLGGAVGTAERAAEVLRIRHSDLQIAGTDCPTLSDEFEENKLELARIAIALKKARPDIVYVALGSPKQEILINHLFPLLPNAWWIGVGISFSYLSGRVRRPPAWVAQLGMEWLYRLWLEPRRLSKRYLVDDLPFCGRLLFQAVVLGIRRSRFGTSRM